MKTIIVPIDFSRLSLVGLELAKIMALKTEAEIEMVHVTAYHETMPDSKITTEADYVEEEFEKIISSFTDKYGKDIILKYITKEGKIHDEIIRQADASKDSIIVTSTHGGSGLEELFVGSNAYKIVSSSNRPVITVRGFKVPEKIGKILLPIDSTNETREKVPFTAKLARLFNAQVQIVTVNSSELEDIKKRLDQYSRQVEQYMKNLDIPCETAQLTGNNITDITIDYAVNNGSDLISIMTEQEKSLNNILLGNYAHQMINKSPLPVLLFPTRHIGVITETFRTEGIDY